MPNLRQWRFTVLIVACTIFLFCASVVRAQDCPKTSSRIGFHGDFVSNPSSGHTVSGSLFIIDDCTFEVRGLTQTPSGPDVFFWMADGSTSQQIREGKRLADYQIEGTIRNPINVVVKKDPSISWEEVKVISMWCEAFRSNFGHVVLKDVVVPTTPAVPLPSFNNCATLLENRLNFHWKRPVNGQMEVLMEGFLNGGDTSGWFGFGMSQDSSRVSMIGATMMVVGFDRNDKPFALPYTASERSQCDYSGTRSIGVCPDTTRNVTLVSGLRQRGNYVTIQYIFDLNEIPMNRSFFALYAIGPISDSNDEPIILFHGSNHAPTNYQFNFQTEGTNCRPLQNLDSSEGIQPVGTISDQTTFIVTIGPNVNYPNPPAWGISYHINGQESPVLQVVRGVEYTFEVRSGEDHPFYITDSAIGGESDSQEEVFAGGANSFGDESNAAIVKWTPNDDTPSLVYYQCVTHQKLGWQIQVLSSSVGSATYCKPKSAAAPILIMLVIMSLYFS